MNEKIFIISADNAAAIVNLLAYEYYARLKRRYMAAGIDDKPSFEAFYAECSKTLEMNILPYEAWKCGYYLIADLFDDNEYNGTPCDEEARFNQAVGELLAMFNNRK